LAQAAENYASRLIYIEPGPDTDPATPIGEICADGPIEIVVAQGRGSYVRLGVAAPLAPVARRRES
jgi:hypothetical protein